MTYSRDTLRACFSRRSRQLSRASSDGNDAAVPARGVILTAPSFSQAVAVMRGALSV